MHNAKIAVDTSDQPLFTYKNIAALLRFVTIKISCEIR